MAEATGIEWCDSTFNPFIGCTKVGPGCDNCYAEELMDKRMHIVQWGPGQPRHRTGEKNWNAPVRWEREHEAFFAEHGRRRRVFCASLADVFDNEVDPQWLADLLDVIRLTPNLDWLLLTKRIGNWRSRLEAVAQITVGRRMALNLWLSGWLFAGQPPANVWLGATVVNQPEYDRDIGKLRRIPAAVRFLSIEPMLGHIDMRMGGASVPDYAEHRPLLPLDWVIVGGESGPKARPMHPDWTRSMRDQCAAAGVPFLFKQWGEWKPISEMDDAEARSLYTSRVKAAFHEDQSEIDDSYGRRCTVDTGVIHLDSSLHGICEPMTFLVGTGAMQTFKLGKKAAGRLLDGIEHNGYPSTERIAA